MISYILDALLNERNNTYDTQQLHFLATGAVRLLLSDSVFLAGGGLILSPLILLASLPWACWLECKILAMLTKVYSTLVLFLALT